MLHQINPGHTLVFSTSKAFTRTLASLATQKDPLLEVFVEGSSAQNQLLLEKLRLLQHELFFATMAGGFSEGVEIKDRRTHASKITLIIFTGIPQPPPTVTQLLLEYHYVRRYGL